MRAEWQKSLRNNSYAQIIQLCEQGIIVDPSSNINYWYLGLAYFFNGNEDLAKTIWSSRLEGVLHDDLSIQELCEILIQEALEQEQIQKHDIALKIRRQIAHISPQNFDNLVQIVYLYLQLKIFTLEVLQELNLLDLNRFGTVNSSSLFQLIQNILYSPLDEEKSLDFVSSLLPYAEDKEGCINMLLYVAPKAKKLETSMKIIDMCLQISPNSIAVLGCAVQLYINNSCYDKSIKIARGIVSIAKNLTEKIVATHLLLGALMSAGGYWQEAQKAFADYQYLLTELVDQNPIDIPIITRSYLCLSFFYNPYFTDTPRITRPIQNQVLSLFQANIQHSNPTQTYKHDLVKQKGKKLKIAYLSTNLRKHSIGWLARSLFQYHNHNDFEIYGYFPEYQDNKDFLQEWYISQMDTAYKGWGNELKVAEQIYNDEIDILIDLESSTSGACCNIVALKPAPLQATWLGWDASGIPAIDYFIADPYVLPENAQEYYSEKIWRLPQTYIAVDGFETSVATLRRSDLDISGDAIVYFSSQKSYKRHPDTVRSQMQIIKQVPNSYFLIKGIADEKTMQEYFYEMAELEGVNSDRLRFLPSVRSEQEHRANMAIADIVLDTYPYNGATTTMETLWMGIPLVTRVGEQFVARNSYAMMMNAGITEGIAWSDEEYIKWGIRFGSEPNLRREVSWKLRESRKTSSLWNGRQFAKEMEKAYTEMWNIYLQRK
ncbi:O-linked N-acetylglucosamine transferase, SPINDLY family protein [Pseudanabaena sp. BC1403]|uniref:O-linked N-acetylglucosamine transferase, SPINDLY family protein n=1 Tax=Pseudanabaena sp. BC1403 TaxID=2043171 RepID=UPI000CD920BC|nr:O-linked N-acetylglucosamine transferase, SPINDLY family protein [Pseudanabaena sp. BC1403]